MKNVEVFTVKRSSNVVTNITLRFVFSPKNLSSPMMKYCVSLLFSVIVLWSELAVVVAPAARLSLILSPPRAS